MDAKTKYQLVEKIIQTEDDQILNEIKSILEKVSVRYSIPAYNRQLNEADQQIENGKFISQEDLEKESDQW